MSPVLKGDTSPVLEPLGPPFQRGLIRDIPRERSRAALASALPRLRGPEDGNAGATNKPTGHGPSASLISAFSAPGFGVLHPVFRHVGHQEVTMFRA